MAWTKEKQATYYRKWHAEHKEERVAYMKEYNFSPRGRAMNMLHGASKRARNKKIPFDLTEAWVTEQLRDGVCCRTGIEFDYEPMPKRNQRNPWAPSLDQIDPSKGYTKANTQVVIAMYNYAKMTFTDDEVLKMAQSLASTHLVKRFTQQHN